MTHPLNSGKLIRSFGGSFVYEIIGPCCRLYDKEELPWPSCSLTWRGKQPSWNRIGPRFVPDMAANRCPSYSVKGYDHFGNTWQDVISLYDTKLIPSEKKWWIWKGPSHIEPPDTIDAMENRLANGERW